MAKESKRSWWQNWIGILVGVGTLCTIILGAVTFLYSTFPTHEFVAMADQKIKEQVDSNSKETINTFREVQTAIKQLSLESKYERLLKQENRYSDLLKKNPDDVSLKNDLRKIKNKLKKIEEELTP